MERLKQMLKSGQIPRKDNGTASQNQGIKFAFKICGNSTKSLTMQNNCKVINKTNTENFLSLCLIYMHRYFL